MLLYYLLCSNHFTWEMTVWRTHGYDTYLSKLWKTIAKYRRAEKLLRHNLISTLFVVLPMQQHMAPYHLQLHWVCLSNGTSAVSQYVSTNLFLQHLLNPILFSSEFILLYIAATAVDTQFYVCENHNYVSLGILLCNLAEEGQYLYYLQTS